MKKIIYLLLIGFSFFQITTNSFVVAQGPPPGVTDDLFCEDFDTTARAWKMTRSNIPVSRPDSFYLDTVVTKDGSYGAATDTCADRTTSYLTTPKIAITGYSSIGVQFDQICYIDQFDDAIVEYSFDKGDTWTRLPEIYDDNGSPRAVYTGGSVYDWLGGDFKFDKASRRDKWKLNDSLFVWGKNSDAWVTENFDLTYLILRNPTPVDTLQIRLGLRDDPASTAGRTGLHAWYVDNFCVRGANCELVPPTIDLLDPPRDYVQRYEGRVYQSPPYILDARLRDNLGIDTGYIVYQHRRDTSVFPATDEWKLLRVDTIPMNRNPGNNFTGEIPAIAGLGADKDTIRAGDSIYWKVVTVDKSDCRNTVQDPPEGISKFIVIGDLPKSCNTQPVFDYPYIQTFDASSFILGTSGVLDDGWQNIRGDFHNWWVNSGATQTPNTGPSESIGPGGKYLYVESSNFKDSSAYLLSPCFDFSSDVLTNGLVKFYLNMNTSSLDDTIRVDIFDPTPRTGLPFGRFVEDVIPPVVGNKGDVWLPFEFSSYPYRNRITQLRFRGKPGNNSGFGDMALDSFKIVPAALTDLRLNPYSLAPYSPIGTNDPVFVNVQNLGTSAATAITFNFEIISDLNIITASGSTTWTGNLNPGESRQIRLDPPMDYDVPEGQYTLKTWLTFAGDVVASNDTSFSRSIGLENFVGKYMDNFDGKNLWTTITDKDNLDNKWELGKPNYDATNSVITEPNAWDILLNRPYTGNGVTISLLSPFIDMSNSDSTILSFLNNRDIEETEDGVFVEYSFDRGITWDRIVAVSDPLQKAWYNSFLQDGGLGGTPVLADRTNCWEKTWGGWLESEVLLPDNFDNKKEVLLRFSFFAADDDDGNDGLSMDNFLVYDPADIDLEPQFNLSPNSACDLTSDMQFNTVIKNRGLDDVSTFEVEYIVTHVPTNTAEIKTDVVNRTILTRDTIHVLSASTFDMTKLGDYMVNIITKVPSDGCIENDTLTKLIENIDGCSLRFVIETSGRKINTQLPCDSSVWRFNYTSGGRSYQVAKAYNDPDYAIGFTPGFKINNLFVCIKNNSQVIFNLNDIDTLVEKYSFIAFDGEQDTILYEDVRGGSDSPTQIFEWNCPPELAISPVAIRLDNEEPQLPSSKEYIVDAIILNDGLTALDSVTVELKVDQVSRAITTYRFPTPIKYNRRASVSFGKQFLAAGTRELCIETTLPNGRPDQIPGDDILCRTLIFMDTINNGGVDFELIDIGGDTLPFNPKDTIGGNDSTKIHFLGFCEDFEDPTTPLWVAVSNTAYRQTGISFEQGTPTTPFINSVPSGSNAWVTDLDDSYPDIDTSSLLSPYMYLRKDSCYEMSFMHNFYLTDSIHDGGQVQMTTDTGASWVTLGDARGDTVLHGQFGWFNRRHILSIEDNTQNAGWSGISNGWKLARRTIDPRLLDEDQYVAFRWRFRSDGSINSDGWAIDDFCIGKINQTDCFGVGLDESLADASKLYLGQNIPNPAAYSTSIPYFLPKAGQIQFVVVNLLGQPVYEEIGNRPYGEGLLQLDLSNMSKGVYYYWMIFEGERVTNKMIIAK